MKRILVPCDFSPPSIQAFKFAAEIALAGKGEVFLLHIVEVPVLHNSLLVPVKAYENRFLKELKGKANRNFVKMKDQVDKKVKAQLFVEQGTVAAVVNKFVNKKRIDVVIMGTHGTSGFREFSIGSNAEKIVRSSKVPVIAVKKAPRSASFKNIIFPTNVDTVQKQLADSLKALQSFFKAKLHVLFVNTPLNFTRNLVTEKHLNEFAKRYRMKNYTINIYSDISEEDGIINFSTRFKSRIIAMSTHGRKGFGHLLSGSIAEDVVNHVDCPIWTLTEKK